MWKMTLKQQLLEFYWLTNCVFASAISHSLSCPLSSDGPGGHLFYFKVTLLASFFATWLIFFCALDTVDPNFVLDPLPFLFSCFIPSTVMFRSDNYSPLQGRMTWEGVCFYFWTLNFLFHFWPNTVRSFSFSFSALMIDSNNYFSLQGCPTWAFLLFENLNSPFRAAAAAAAGEYVCVCVGLSSEGVDQGTQCPQLLSVLSSLEHVPAALNMLWTGGKTRSIQPVSCVLLDDRASILGTITPRN